MLLHWFYRTGIGTQCFPVYANGHSNIYTSPHRNRDSRTAYDKWNTGDFHRDRYEYAHPDTNFNLYSNLNAISNGFRACCYEHIYTHTNLDAFDHFHAVIYAPACKF